MRANEILELAAKTYAERQKVYGDNYKFVGDIMAALFPQGIKVVTADDWNRMHIFLLVVVKLTRYRQNFEAGGHSDSLIDMATYAAMLEEIDREILGAGYRDNRTVEEPHKAP